MEEIVLIMKTFKEFLMAQKESTAAKRAKNAAFLGLAVPGPEASFNAGATANPGMLDYFNKNVKGKIKKQPQVIETAVNHGIDKWLDSVDKLKKDLNSVPQDDERIDDLEDKDDLEDDDEDLEDDEERADDLEDDEEDDDEEDNIEDDKIESKPKFRKRFNDEEIEPSPPEYGDEVEDDEDDEIKDDYEDEDEKKIRTSLKMPQKPGFDEWTKMFSSWNG